MGEIVKASCKCQRRGMRLGVGMMFYYECDEVMRKARSGRFGRELQEAIEQNFPVVINASREIYWCEKCGHFEANYVLDIYKPKDPVGLIMKQLRGSAEEEKAKFLQNPRYYPSLDIESCDEDDVELVYQFPHICSKCKSPMTQITYQELEQKRCATCGEKYRIDEFSFWD